MVNFPLPWSWLPEGHHNPRIPQIKIMVSRSQSVKRSTIQPPNPWILKPTSHTLPPSCRVLNCTMCACRKPVSSRANGCRKGTKTWPAPLAKTCADAGPQGIDNHWIGGIPTPLKNMSQSVGMMKFPIYGKIKLMFQTTSQCFCFPCKCSTMKHMTGDIMA